MRLRFIRPLIILGTLIACNTAGVKKEKNFDFRNFFQREIARLQVNHVKLNKTLVFSGQLEKIMMDTVDWNKELQAFGDIDLSKPAYAGMFSKTESRTEKGEYERYQSMDAKTDLKNAEILRHDGKTLRIEILFEGHANIYQYRKKLVYVTDSFFVIEGMQQVRLMDAVDYRIEGMFVK